MRKTTVKTKQETFQSRLEELNDMVQSKLRQQPTPDQQQFAALRLWMLDHEYHFNQLRTGLF